MDKYHQTVLVQSKVYISPLNDKQQYYDSISPTNTCLIAYHI